MDLLIQVVIVLIVVGIFVYGIQQFAPMDPKIKTFVILIVLLFVCVWLLNVAGVVGSGPWIGHRR
jgi:hypothetical protein